jgi:dihydrofolate synthase/folylpolyglutamate synthase
VLLEIGLGGRLDAFNVIDADIAVITSIGIDHEKFLGNTREAIGAEKAGILRSGQRVVLGADMPASVLSRCRELKVQPLCAGDDFVVSEDSGRQVWSLSWGSERLVNLPMGNLAPSNIALAHQAALGLTQISSAQLGEASARAFIPGRMQQLRYRGRLLVHDVSHNPAAAKFLCQQLTQRNLQPKHVLCAMLADKDHAAVYAAVANFTAAPWTLVDTRGERGFSAAQLANAMQIECDQAPDMPTALHQALACTQPDDVILVFGSFNAIEQSLWLRSHGDAL